MQLLGEHNVRGHHHVHAATYNIQHTTYNTYSIQHTTYIGTRVRMDREGGNPTVIEIREKGEGRDNM
jgi:hypothetical protein